MERRKNANNSFPKQLGKILQNCKIYPATIFAIASINSIGTIKALHQENSSALWL